MHRPSNAARLSPRAVKRGLRGSLSPRRSLRKAWACANLRLNLDMANSKDRSARRVRRHDPASARPAVSAFNVEAKQFGWAIAIAIFAAALAVRLVHIWQLRASPFFSVLMGDSHGYDEWARRLAGGEWIGHEVFYQAPLYPYLLGVIYAIAGRHLLLVRIVQAIIGSASCALLGLAAARLFSRRAG